MKIHFTSGVMGAGKTKELIIVKEATERIAQSFHLPEVIAVAKITTAKGPRLGQVESRSGQKADCVNLCIEETPVEIVASLSKYIKSFKQNELYVKRLFIDEAQFLSPEQVEAIEIVAQIFDLDIQFFGLATDYTGEQFEGSKFILQICDDVIVLHKECEDVDCKEKAMYNARFSGSTIVTSGEQIVEDKGCYAALCSACYRRAKQQK